MGYTHYWAQTRDFTSEEWAQLCEDVNAILKDVQHVQNIPLANGMGKRRTQPTIDGEKIWFNGVGPDDDHETMVITRMAEAREFCKTARKPYDLAVTAVLCYLATVMETHDVSSDGHGANWIAGLEEARRALPRYANVLDIPRPILESDRWCSPWVSGTPDGYEVRFCVDGHGYVLKGEQSYRFDTHQDLAKFLDTTKRAEFRSTCVVDWGNGRDRFDEGKVEKNIWNATGAFDKKRHERIRRAQRKVLDALFPVPAAHAHQPPALVRPGEMPAPERTAYYFSELLDLPSQEAV